MVLMSRIELPTSPLPRECSTTELHQLKYAVAGLIAQAFVPFKWFFHIKCILLDPGIWIRHLIFTMTTEKPNITSQKQDAQKQKQDRLAEALRANLRRRKTQSRARKAIENKNKKDD